MPVSEASVVVPRPISVVWDYCSTPENLAVYLPGTPDVHSISDGPLAVGTVWGGVTRFLGPAIVWKGEFAEVALNRVTLFQSTESSLLFTATSSYEEVDGGTQFTYRLNTEAGLGGLFGKLTDPTVARAYTRALRASLENLIDVLA